MLFIGFDLFYFIKDLRVPLLNCPKFSIVLFRQLYSVRSLQWGWKRSGGFVTKGSFGVGELNPIARASA